ncbi:hypothetical protein F2Q69_00006344 [Brassica cretica]|uniref:Uncharacterized protein n=1 Tax=Brassica cretica TaxID=69181 RepID=A0A8S9P390_BRACR|nr:hypothetical protein F2Q69_00006344 [Brassica cretica]
MSGGISYRTLSPLGSGSGGDCLKLGGFYLGPGGLSFETQRLFVLNPKVIFFEIVLRHPWKAALRLLLFGVSQPGGATQSPDLDTFHVWSSRD